MIACMDDITDQGIEGVRSGAETQRVPIGRTPAAAVDPYEPVCISCDDCSMRCSSACDDCVVTFLLDGGSEESLVLDLDQARVVRLLGNAGLVPDLKFRVAG